MGAVSSCCKYRLYFFNCNKIVRFKLIYCFCEFICNQRQGKVRKGKIDFSHSDVVVLISLSMTFILKINYTCCGLGIICLQRISWYSFKYSYIYCTVSASTYILSSICGGFVKKASESRRHLFIKCANVWAEKIRWMYTEKYIGVVLTALGVKSLKLHISII